MTRPALRLLAIAVVSACTSPDQDAPVEADPIDLSQSAVFDCAGSNLCTGSSAGATSVYASALRVGATSTARGELFQTFTATVAGPVGELRVPLRLLRRVSPAPTVLVSIHPATDVDHADASNAPLASGSLVLDAQPPGGVATFHLSGATALVVGGAYTLRVRVADVPASGSVVLLGVGARLNDPYAGGGAFRGSQRGSAAQAVRPLAGWDVAFSLTLAGQEAPVFVAIGDDVAAPLLRSADGLNWSDVGPPAPVSHAAADPWGLESPAFGVAGSTLWLRDDRVVHGTFNALTWTTLFDADALDPGATVVNYLSTTAVASGGGTLLVLGSGYPAGASSGLVNVIHRSVDGGATWAAPVLVNADEDLVEPDADAWLDLAYGNGVFVALGAQDGVFVSADGGATWAAHSVAGQPWPLSRIAFANGHFVVSSGTEVFVATNPAGAWTQLENTDPIYSLTADGDALFVVVRESYDGQRVVATSLDGSAWTPVFVDAEHELRRFSAGSGRVVGTLDDGSGNGALVTCDAGPSSCQAIPTQPGVRYAVVSTGSGATGVATGGPDPFVFEAAEPPPGRVAESAEIVVSGTGGPWVATCGPGCVGLALNGDWGSGSVLSIAEVRPGDSLAMRAESGPVEGDVVTATVAVGSTVASWSLTSAVCVGGFATLTDSGDFEVPPGCTQLRVLAVGGGAGVDHASGGPSGAVRIAELSLPPGTKRVPVTVGQGGSGNHSVGGASSFGSWLTAAGANGVVGTGNNIGGAGGALPNIHGKYGGSWRLTGTGFGTPGEFDPDYYGLFSQTWVFPGAPGLFGVTQSGKIGGGGGGGGVVIGTSTVRGGDGPTIIARGRGGQGYGAGGGGGGTEFNGVRGTAGSGAPGVVYVEFFDGDELRDVAPDPITFTDLTLPPGEIVQSDTVVLSGFTGPVVVSCVTCRGLVLNGNAGDGDTTLFYEALPGDELAVLGSAPTTPGESRAVTIRVGMTLSSPWTLTAAP